MSFANRLKPNIRIWLIINNSPFESNVNQQSLQLVVSYNFKSNPKVKRNFHFI